jgi:predicted ATP-binding protein involved in virulence
MRLHSLELKDVGPFAEARLDFDSPSNVTLLTGLNGSGKTFVLDAIRFWFGGQYGLVERAVPRATAAAKFLIKPSLTFDQTNYTVSISEPEHSLRTRAQAYDLWALPSVVRSGFAHPDFVLDYWCPTTTAVGAYEVSALEVPDHRGFLEDSLQGTYSRARTTQLIAHADYLRESSDPTEKRLGEALFAAIERIINASLLDGRFSGVARTTLTPYVEQAGHRVPLSGLSAGNAWQINRMLGLLGRMYSAQVLRGGDPAKLHETPGLLLIDEVENHQHPRWQKRFLPLLRETFPNVQIIGTTHSPFVLSSVPDAKVYVSRYDAAARCCTLTDETAVYTHLSVEEILLSGAFDETQPWGDEVSALLEARSRAIQERNESERQRLNGVLARINPTSFGWMKVENAFGPLNREAAS